ncbi:MAG TPA: hypothetical protein VGL35_14270 [Rhizomicrobium sp.]
MTRRLYLHLGPAKTGTSAIQHVLSGHDGSVVLYPRIGLWSDGSHHNLVLNYFGEYTRPEMVREDAGGLLEQIGEMARRSDRDLVISSEILAGRRTLDEFAAALQKAVGCDLRVVLLFVVREHFERAASLYNQRVKDAATSERRDPDDFLIENPERLCYAHQLRRLQRTDFDLRVLSYHPAEDCITRCLQFLGFPVEQIPELPRRNISLGRTALVATLAANRLVETPQDRSRFNEALSRIPGRFAPSEMFFGKDAVARVRPMFAADRKYLRREFGVKLPRADLSNASPFTLSENDFADIASAMASYADDRRPILDMVAHYVRHANNPSEPPEPELADKPREA